MKKFVVLVLSALLLVSPVANRVSADPVSTADEKQIKKLRKDLKKEFGLNWLGKIADDPDDWYRVAEYDSEIIFPYFAEDFVQAYFKGDYNTHPSYRIIDRNTDLVYSVSPSKDMLFVSAEIYKEGEENSASTFCQREPVVYYDVNRSTGAVEKSFTLDTFFAYMDYLLSENYNHYSIDTDEDMDVICKVWEDGFAEEITAAYYSHDTAGESQYISLRRLMKTNAQSFYETLQVHEPGTGMLFCLSNDLDTEKQLLVYYNGELTYDAYSDIQ